MMNEEFLQQFGLRLARLINPGLPLPTVQAAIIQTIGEARDSGQLPKARIAESSGNDFNLPMMQECEIVYVHDCRNHGCNVHHCVLCKHNPNKRCTGNFAGKYWVGDRLLAKCEGEIQVELIDPSTGDRIAEDLSSYRLEVCILDGNRYNKLCREAGEQRLDILDECEVLLNQKMEPLLQSVSANNTKNDPRVLLKFQPGTATVPLREVKVSESSESVLAGTKRPPFRLVVRAVHESGARLSVRPAVSEEFVVVTKRTKNLKKQDIPSLDDPIAKLNHVGKETVKKLNELKASADEIQMDLLLPPELSRITKVREFLRLVTFSEADGHLQQKLKQLLKLSKEKWEAACEHAKTAVQMDNRMRAWYKQNMSVGLLYTCSLGGVRPDRPVALIQNRKRNGADFMEVIPMEHQLPAQREQVQGTCEHAIRCWWEDAHPGWMIFTLGNQHFETLDQIIKFSRGDSRIAPVLQAPQEGEGGSAAPTFSDEGQGIADSVSSDGSGGADHSPRQQAQNSQRPNSKQSETDPTPPVDRPASPITSSPAAMPGESPHAAAAQSPTADNTPSRHGKEREGGARQPQGLGGLPEAAAQGSGDTFNPNPFENLTGEPYQGRGPPQLGVDGGGRLGSAVDQMPPGMSAFWPQAEALAAAGNLSAADYPGMMNSLQDLMKLGGSIPSLGAFPSFFGARSLTDPTGLAAFSAANFGQPLPPGDGGSMPGRGLGSSQPPPAFQPASQLPGNKRKFMGLGLGGAAEKQPRSQPPEDASEGIL